MKQRQARGAPASLLGGGASSATTTTTALNSEAGGESSQSAGADAASHKQAASFCFTPVAMRNCVAYLQLTDLARFQYVNREAYLSTHHYLNALGDTATSPQYRYRLAALSHSLFNRHHRALKQLRAPVDAATAQQLHQRRRFITQLTRYSAEYAQLSQAALATFNLLALDWEAQATSGAGRGELDAYQRASHISKIIANITANLALGTPEAFSLLSAYYRYRRLDGARQLIRTLAVRRFKRKQEESPYNVDAVHEILCGTALVDTDFAIIHIKKLLTILCDYRDVGEKTFDADALPDYYSQANEKMYAYCLRLASINAETLTIVLDVIVGWPDLQALDYDSAMHLAYIAAWLTAFKSKLSVDAHRQLSKLLARCRDHSVWMDTGTNGYQRQFPNQSFVDKAQTNLAATALAITDPVWLKKDGLKRQHQPVTLVTRTSYPKVKLFSAGLPVFVLPKKYKKLYDEVVDDDERRQPFSAIDGAFMQAIKSSDPRVCKEAVRACLIHSEWLDHIPPQACERIVDALLALPTNLDIDTLEYAIVFMGAVFKRNKLPITRYDAVFCWLQKLVFEHNCKDIRLQACTALTYALRKVPYAGMHGLAQSLLGTLLVSIISDTDGACGRLFDGNEGDIFMHLLRYLMYRARPLSPAMINEMAIALASLLNYCKALHQKGMPSQNESQRALKNGPICLFNVRSETLDRLYRVLCGYCFYHTNDIPCTLMENILDCFTLNADFALKKPPPGDGGQNDDGDDSIYNAVATFMTCISTVKHSTATVFALSRLLGVVIPADVASRTAPARCSFDVMVVRYLGGCARHVIALEQPQQRQLVDWCLAGDWPSDDDAVYEAIALIVSAWVESGITVIRPVVQSAGASVMRSVTTTTTTTTTQAPHGDESVKPKPTPPTVIHRGAHLRLDDLLERLTTHTRMKFNLRTLLLSSACHHARQLDLIDLNLFLEWLPSRHTTIAIDDDAYLLPVITAVTVLQTLFKTPIIITKNNEYCAALLDAAPQLLVLVQTLGRRCRRCANADRVAKYNFIISEVLDFIEPILRHLAVDEALIRLFAETCQYSTSLSQLNKLLDALPEAKRALFFAVNMQTHAAALATHHPTLSRKHVPIAIGSATPPLSASMQQRFYASPEAVLSDRMMATLAMNAQALLYEQGEATQMSSFSKTMNIIANATAYDNNILAVMETVSAELRKIDSDKRKTVNQTFKGDTQALEQFYLTLQDHLRLVQRMMFPQTEATVCDSSAASMVARPASSSPNV